MRETAESRSAANAIHLAQRHVIFLVIVLVITCLSALAWKTIDDRQKEYTVASSALQLQNQALGNAFENAFGSAEQILSNLSELQQLHSAPSHPLDLRGKLLRAPFLQDLRYFGPNRTLLTRGGLTPLDSSELPDWVVAQQAMGRSHGFGGVQNGFSFFTTLRTTNHDVTGTFLATFAGNYFREVAEQIPGSEVVASFLLGPSNELLLDMVTSDSAVHLNEAAQLAHHIGAVKLGSGVAEFGANLVAIQQFRSQPIRLVQAVPNEVVYARWTLRWVQSGVIGGLIIAVATFFLLYWLRAQNQARFAANAIHELQQEQERLIKSIPVGVYKYRVRVSGEQQFDYVSERLCQDLGLKAADILRDASLPFDAYLAPDADTLRLATANALSTDGHMVFEGRLKGDPAQPRWLRLESNLTRMANGDQVWHGVQSDITERKLAEATLQRQATELLRSNAELEQFSYSISHDMRQPLRMVSSYLQLLNRSLGDTLNAEQREYFSFAIDGAKRMDAMMLGLLDYSRVGRKGEPLAWCESRTVLNEALLFLRPLVVEAQAEIRIEGDWPRVIASPDELLRLLQNLVGNALKFRVAGRPPQITIVGETQGDQWQVCITDNGVGIAPDQINRLFQVFQRLQSRAVYEGTGIGLALCRKIVERHGGTIRAESEGEGLGSRFTFRLPVAAGASETSAGASV